MVLALVLSGVCAAALGPGCSSQSDNEREFLRTAKPGVPAEDPNEKVAQRKMRTRIMSPLEKRIEQQRARAEERRKPKEAQTVAPD
jgi:hypothetical protein